MISPDHRRDDLDDEIRHHVLECADLLVRQGWSRADARAEAERRFGDVDRIRGEMADARAGGRGTAGPGALLRSAGSDLCYALRGLRGSPGFAAAIVATLGLGLGAASSIFSVVDALLLRPLPYAAAERLVEVNHAAWQSHGYTPGTTASRVRGWQEAASGLADGWVAWRLLSLVRTDGAAAEELAVVAVTPGADTLLGIPLLLGRAFSADDGRPGSADVAVLGRGYYERLGGDPGIVGRTLRLESGPVTVVGVLRGGVRFPTWGGDADLWIPIRDDFTAADRPIPNVGGLWARLRPGVSLAAAKERADVLAATLQEQEPLEDGWAVRLEPVGAHRAGSDLKRALWTLSATVAALLLIAWVNGVNLVLVRASARSREMAVRLAIGGSRLRLVRQLLVEGLVMGVLGGLAALALAILAVTGIRGIIPWVVAYSSPHPLEVEARTLAFAFGASLLVGTVLGLAPALQAMRGGGLSSLAGQRSDDAPGGRRLRSGLVVAQIALSMTLLAGAGLFVKSFARLVSVDPGYDYERIALADIGLSPNRYPGAADRADFFRRLEEALEARPGIEAVTRTEGRGFRSGVALEPEDGRPPLDQPNVVPSAPIALDYVEVMGLDLVAGRAFEPADAGSDAVMIDQDLARLLWGRGSAVGRRFRLAEDEAWLTVVGVVRELRLMGRDQREGPYQILYPSSPDGADPWVEVAVRVAGDPRSALVPIRDAVGELDPEQTIWRLRTAADALAQVEEEPRFLATLVSLLALVAVLLAAVGLYGVLAFSVARRDRELAVRMALGADGTRVRAMVLGEGLVVAAAGVVLGLLGALAASRAVEQLLYEVQPHDPATLAVTASLFLAVAAVASFLPARRATRVDPAAMLRRE
ncbi:MAG: ADOP family duplicated permease [Gemmatimonadetes bacterium]|nr:ADOP family duplicated permease [Gemmatimonadota bacterium]